MRAWFGGFVFATALAGCGEDHPFLLVERWSHTTPATPAPPGLGVEGRVVVLLEDPGPNGPELVTLDDGSGLPIEGPLPIAQLSLHSPSMSGSTIFLVTKIGKVAAINVAGNRLWERDDTFGLSTGLLLLPDGSLRIASTAGVLVGLSAADGADLFPPIRLGSPATSITSGPNGAALVTTEAGRVLGVDGQGASFFEAAVAGPASGPSLSSAGDVAVGAIDGLSVFDARGNLRFHRAREGRVIGTRFLASQEILAWGEDGKLERLDANGTIKASFVGGGSNPAPIYLAPAELPKGRLGVVDDGGTAHFVDADGSELATLSLGASPKRELAQAESGAIFVALPDSIRSLAFSAAEE